MRIKQFFLLPEHPYWPILRQNSLTRSLKGEVESVLHADANAAHSPNADEKGVENFVIQSL